MVAGRRRYKYGWGECSCCGYIDVGATKNGLAVRHLFIRIRKGYRRLAFPDLKAGHDYHACAGSGKPLLNWFNP